MRVPNISLTKLAVATAAAAAFAVPSITVAEDEVPRWQQARATGDTESCISTRSIRNTRVHDDRTIDFHMRGGRVYRNTLPNRCGGLGFSESFAYRTSINRLCSSDIITVLRQPVATGIHGPRCGLGQFQEIELPERG